MPPPATVLPTTLPVHRHLTDEDLLIEVRQGDATAYAELYRRYEREATAFARSLVGSQDAGDVVGEAFTKMLNALHRGHGPVDNPVRYLMVSVRTSAATLRGRHVRDRSLDERIRGVDRGADSGRGTEVEAAAQADEHLVRAFRSLSSKRRQVLWWSEVEALSPSEIGVRLGINAAAASALTYRARKALRTAHRLEEEAAAAFERRLAARSATGA